ncbi:MAG TPA: hypothetical protein VKU00_25700 [Chthonomonadaceae bacterium]|nr:hypothetical protein [Chthonomonadaceae bacterium]
MPTPGSPSSGPTPTSIRRGRFIMFWIWSLLVFGGGLYLGNTATKNALNGPDWLRRLLGVNAPVQPIQNPPSPNQPFTNQPNNPPAQNLPPGNNPPNNGSMSNNGGMSNNPSESNPPANEQTFLGSWTTEEDETQQDNTTKKVTYLYTFNKDGSGTFSVDGQKSADIKWDNSGDMMNLTFTTGNGSAGRFWKIKEKWFTNPEKTLLTFVPQGSQDSSAEMGTGGTKILNRKQ